MDWICEVESRVRQADDSRPATQGPQRTATEAEAIVGLSGRAGRTWEPPGHATLWQAPGSTQSSIEHFEHFEHLYTKAGSKG